MEPGDRLLIVVGQLPPHLSGARLRYQLASMDIPHGIPPSQLFNQVYDRLSQQMNGTGKRMIWRPAMRFRPTCVVSLNKTI